MTTDQHRVRVEAPADWDLIDVAQAIIGPSYLLKADNQSGRRTFARHRALQEQLDRLEGDYLAQVRKMIQRIREYVEKHIILGSLDKAGPTKTVPHPQELKELRKIIEDFHLAFAAGTVGPESISPHDVQRLIDAGILPSDLAFTFQPDPGELPPEAQRYIEDAYLYGKWFGQAETPITEAAIRNASNTEFIQRKPRIRLTQDEKSGIEWAKHSAALLCVGLGNRIADDFSTTVIEADADMRRRYTGVIQDVLVEGLQRREAWRKIASQLGHKTGDWARDFRRIAATEKQKAMQEGVSSGLIHRHGDPKFIRVAKQPNPDACPDCLRLHLLPDGTPRIFKLSDLVENGTNHGRGRLSWRPVVGPVHPWCACALLHVPPGWAFDDDGNLAPQSLSRAGFLDIDLEKGINKDKPEAKHLTYVKTVPDHGVVVRVADPTTREEIEAVIAATPSEIFDKEVGVTLITTDMPRVQNPLDDHDFAYWTNNEIRLMQTLPAEKIARVLPHELGHSLNVYLMRKFGSTEAVRKWHRKLWKISKREGFVSRYAKKLPIENAAEVTMLYLYQRPKLMIRWPRQFAFVHDAYRGIWKRDAS